ncbi:hypothetical protein BDQ17DRAFT_1368930 [Cyathus striatus]|nr:hypothetical protein BDQ17DRAFT_1368930 [Cyathus striatus]
MSRLIQLLTQLSASPTLKAFLTNSLEINTTIPHNLHSPQHPLYPISARYIEICEAKRSRDRCLSFRFASSPPSESKQPD